MWLLRPGLRLTPRPLRRHLAALLAGVHGAGGVRGARRAAADPNGKLDRQALPVPARAGCELPVAADAARRRSSAICSPRFCAWRGWGSTTIFSRWAAIRCWRRGW